MKKFIGKKVPVEVLVGRGYEHYIDGEVAADQPDYLMGCFALMFEDVNIKNHEGATVLTEKDRKEMNYCLPYDCWVKRIAKPWHPCEKYILAVVVEEDKIKYTVCSEETIIPHGDGRINDFGDSVEDGREYEELDDYPTAVKIELSRLVAGRFLPERANLEQMPVPEKFLEHASGHEFCCLVSSAYRMACMEARIYIDEEGLIGAIDYSTVQMTEADYADEHPREVEIDNCIDEAFDTFLHIVDQYTQEEYEGIVSQIQE